MLKALELSGFKSFADKTRLEFPRGISVVVGPNGSGKSNIVDAIKWVLGEQSVRSLRGREMADVIFNGSASRRAQNTAEATLIFDNAAGALPIDAPEVHVTRRVYRSGEGEYLINRQPSRLRDIRDLFSGTGMGSDAYSIIEQGKVDVLLQASPRDRRLIFEEAAGISRFKPKKIEAQRRLERVEQNLLRLSDIVEEVGSRLKSVRQQASKARTYKELAARLQELRTQVAAADWRRLTAELAELDGELQQLQADAGRLTTDAGNLEARMAAIDEELQDLDEYVRNLGGASAANREQIARAEAAVDHGRRRLRDLEEEADRLGRQSVAVRRRAGYVEAEQAEIAAQLAQIEVHKRQAAGQLADAERQLTTTTRQVDRLRAEVEQHRAALQELSRQTSQLGRTAGALEARVDAAETARERYLIELESLAQQAEGLAGELVQMRAQEEQLSRRAAEQESVVRALESQQSAQNEQLARGRRAIAALRERQAGGVERAAVLEELERRLEGLHPGVKGLLLRAREATGGPLKHIRGLVADVLRVSVEHVPLVEAALGQSAQCLVWDGSAAELALLAADSQLAGRVELVRMPAMGEPSIVAPVRQGPGVLARADSLVAADQEFQPLVQRLLGRTWVVESLADALSLAEAAEPHEVFVTADGAVVRGRTSVALGPQHVASGIMSRRSELRALAEQLAAWARELAALEGERQSTEQRLAQLSDELHSARSDHANVAAQLSQQQLPISAALERQKHLAGRHVAAAAQLGSATAELTRATEGLDECRRQQADADAALEEAQNRLDRETAALEQLETSRLHNERETASAKIELARLEQQAESLATHATALVREGAERGQATSDLRAQQQRCSQLACEAELAILAATSQLAEAFLQKEAFGATTADQRSLREARREERAAALHEVQRQRARLRKVEVRLHAKDLAAEQLRHERTTLSERLHEDYAIDLEDLQHQPTAEEERERKTVEQEIADLRNRLNSIGPVNLDALSELDELETRHNHLAAQYTDLTTAKSALEQIIGRINADSRRLFGETLEVVRGHFQTLFRKLFGGGQADIVLEDGVDLLESGIEIVARPPGKEPRNISLLSGGEKTLTCVAMLLAIFRSRPSPFCVLDEVDAALDEANIERFIGVLHEFLAWTQFIVVTHSKKTMTCANTLHGVTMEESGVSKRVSVRFEDVSETGEILNFRDTPPAEQGSQGPDETQAA